MSSDRHVRENIHIYSCKAPTARGGCGKIVVSGPRLDELIEALVLRYLEHRVIRREVAPWTGQVELDQVQARITELMAAFGSGDLSSEVVFPTVKRLEERAAELKSEQATFLTALIQANEPEDVVKAWPTYEFEQKRLVLERLIEAVIVKPAPRKGGRFRPERIEVVWKEAGQARPTQPQSAPEPLQAAG